MKKKSIAAVLLGVSLVVMAIPQPQTVTAEQVKTVPHVEKSMSYNVPLDLDLQLYIICLCEKYHIEPALVLAMIEVESQYNAEMVGDNGNSQGLMQIQERFHMERMQKLGVSDLLDPYQNVRVGLDFLAELIEKYGDTEKALCVYNAGATGANRLYFSKGVYSSEYSKKVVEKCESLKNQYRLVKDTEN